MARDRERTYSESENLSALDREYVLDEEDERRAPAWAQRMEEEKNASRAKEAREDEPMPENAPLRQGSGNDASAAPESKRAAREAWQREAKRVESSQRPSDGDTEEDRDEQEKPRAKKPRKAGKNNKRSQRRKKRSGDADERRSFIHSIAVAAVCVFVFLMVAVMIVSNFVSHPLLTIPRRVVTAVVTPVQRLFSGLTESVAGYLRTLKVRGNLEYNYEQLTILLDDYANQIAINEELRKINEELYDQLDEHKRKRAMNPVNATVIGHDSGNYFSTLTLDVGSVDGVEDYMAVVHGGGLVGVTYNVRASECQVRCIINSDCTVAALVQSNRDQGSVKGTLGVNGEPMCRMYYLPDNSLPRPGDMVVTSGVGLEFPKGIPIGYIRESTRGMEDNKSYVVLEPVVDFQHLEYVTVYRYKPTYAEPAQQRDTTAGELILEKHTTARPIPTFQVEGMSDFLFSAAPDAVSAEATAAPSTTPAPTATPRATATPDPNATPHPTNIDYSELGGDRGTPGPTARPTFTPTPSPVPTQDPGSMTVEDDE